MKNIGGVNSTGLSLTNYSVSVTKTKAILEKMNISKARLYDGCHGNPRANVLSFYSGFSEAFDTVPHFELIVQIV